LVAQSIVTAEEFFWLTNAYVELAIVIVLAYEEGSVLDSRAFMELEVPAKALQ
jgi:hypothetical protein